MYGFEYPELFIVFPLIAYCLYRCIEKSAPQYFVHLALFKLREGSFDKLFWYKIGLFFWLVVTLASPVYVDTKDPKNREGIAIALAIDASGSMVGRGFSTELYKQSKFESVKEVLHSFIQKRINDNIAIILFGDFAFTASPLSYEKSALEHMVKYLTLGMAGENTAIGEGINESIEALSVSKAKERIVILLTDGVHNAGRIAPSQAVQKAQREGIKIYTIGIGEANDYDRSMLMRVAKESKGYFFEAPTKEALVKVYNQIDTLEASKLRSRDYAFKTYYYPYALLIALLFFARLLQLWLGARR